MDLKPLEPIYLQLKNYYEHLIDIKALKEGEPMPSVRETAIAYQVNPNTVQRAFSIMVEEGYLTNISKKGFFIKKKVSTIDKSKLIKEALRPLLDNNVTKEEIMAYLKGENK